MEVLAVPLMDLISFSALFLISEMALGRGYWKVHQDDAYEALNVEPEAVLSRNVSGYWLHRRLWQGLTETARLEVDRRERCGMWKRGENWEHPWLAS